MRGVRLDEPAHRGGVHLRPGWDGEKTRGLILEAILDLPLGATMREVAARIGKHVNTVDHHVKRLRKSGQVQVVKRGFNKRKVVVPIRLKVSEAEAEWLKLGPITARAIVVVARGEGQRVTSREVAKALGWHLSTARYHLVRASQAGILKGRPMAGYVLTCGAVEQERAGLHPRAWSAVRHIAEAGRRVSSCEVARAFGWSVPSAKFHLKRAVKAGLLNARNMGASGGDTLSPNARAINWSKSNLAPA